jgi:hypothetical protein
VAVYRLHPLLPDRVRFFDAGDGDEIDTLPMQDLIMGPGEQGVRRPRSVIERVEAHNAFYSLGVANAGAITLRNYPEFLRTLTRYDGQQLDVAAVDVFRTRECAIARYNDFRRMFRLAPAARWEDLAGGDPSLARDMRAVYSGDLDAVDLMVGLFGERRPAGFAFGETAFRVFLLMASRRLRSDRFFTQDFRPEIYSPVGMRWLAETSLSDMLRRHYPRLSGALDGVENPFKPWSAHAG